MLSYGGTPNPRSERLRVTIYPSTDIANIEFGLVHGLDVSRYLLSGSVSASIDNAAMQMSLVFWRGQGQALLDGAAVDVDSLSPWMTGSDFNAINLLLWPGNHLTVDFDVSEAGTTGEFQRLGAFRVDSVDAAGADVITLTGRDSVSATLLDTIIRTGLTTPPLTDLTFGADDGSKTAEQVMQDILDAFAPAFAVVTPTPSAFAIKAYQQQEGQSVLDALRTVAQQRGWDIRWFQSTGLTFYDPDRAFSGRRRVPDATFAPADYTDVTQLKADDGDVRNIVQVWYGGAARQTVTVSDALSIAQFGDRFMRISEDRSSAIDTLDEATTLANAALADLKDPLASHAVALPFFPWVELNDVHIYEPNGVHYDAEMKLAVATYEHRFDALGRAETTIGGRIRPLAAVREYRRGAPQRVLVFTTDPAGIAPEGAIWFKVPSIAFA